MFAGSKYIKKYGRYNNMNKLQYYTACSSYIYNL